MIERGVARGENVGTVPRTVFLMSHFVFPPLRLTACAAALLVPLLLGSCKSKSSRIRGVPANLPVINLHGSAATPSHSMSRADYPFDAKGDYVTAWAAEGETRAGRGAASSRDYSQWKSSHRSSTLSKPVKVSSGSSSRSKSSSSGRRHTVRSGDTLSGIARKYGTSVSKIKAANGLKSDMIRSGSSLKIP